MDCPALSLHAPPETGLTTLACVTRSTGLSNKLSSPFFNLKQAAG